MCIYIYTFIYSRFVQKNQKEPTRTLHDIFGQIPQAGLGCPFASSSQIELHQIISGQTDQSEYSIWLIDGFFFNTKIGHVPKELCCYTLLELGVTSGDVTS